MTDRAGSRGRVEGALLELLAHRRRLRDAPPPDARFRGPEVIRAGLQRWMGDEHGPHARVSDLRRLSGAGTNELYAFTLHRGGARESLVLRVKVPGSGVVTHLGREVQAMRAVDGLIPVPRPRWSTHDARYLGAPAVVTDFSPGVQAPRGQVTRASGMGTRYPEPLRSKLAPQFVTYEALLHAFDVSRADLDTFEPPRAGTTDAVDWRLAFWDRVWDEDRLEEHPSMSLARDWLWEHRPVVDVVSLLHGDYRNGNFLFDEERGVVTAVIDWEMTWIGDRHADLAYTMFKSFGHVEDGVTLVAGLLDAGRFVAAYEEVSGLPVDPERLHYYFVFNMYWSNISLLATGLRNAAAGMTQLDVMYQTMAGKGVMSCAALNRVLFGGAR
ncbi:phosphotransferase family protein [Phytohabitans kaempferiae]|uniref:Phosphotransferase family protein n=1 Tax=Phytohabitans kaempferiae TaxID=1620943 RepID=A0ABV6M325_9ACTN